MLELNKETSVMRRADAEQLLGISPNLLIKWIERSKGGVDEITLRNGNVDLVEVAKYILSRTDKGRPMPLLKDKANEVLKFYGDKVSESVKKSSKDVKKPAKSKKSDNKTEDISPAIAKFNELYGKFASKEEKPLEIRVSDLEGLEEALKRISTLEVKIARMVEMSLDDEDDRSLTLNINNWQKMLDVLRKTELDCLKVLQEKGKLISVDEAVKAYEKGILPVRQKLQSFPTQMSILLENQKASIIQKILEQEIEKLLVNIANIWDN